MFLASTIAAIGPRPDVATADVDFAALTTLRIGGAPAATVVCRSADAVAEVVGTLDEQDIPLLVVGGGSNLVVGQDVADLVVVLITADDADMTDTPVHIDTDTGLVRAFAGVVWDDLVAATVDAGLGGLECLSGIPGSVGATPVQNVGAYGAEVSQVLHRVQLFDRTTGELQCVSPESLDLAYRYSNLKFTNRAVVTAVEFQLNPDGLSAPLRFGELARRLGVSEEEGAAGQARRPVADVRDAVLALRAGKGMVLDDADHDTWSAGSFFTNPVVTGEDTRDAVIEAVTSRCGTEAAASMPCYPAGTDAAGRTQFKFSAAWLIERAGFPKGWQVPAEQGGTGRAGLSTKHTLALTNRGSAVSEDIVELARAVRAGVQDAFGVTLVPEPVWIGVTIDG